MAMAREQQPGTMADVGYPGPASRNCSGPQDRGSVAAEAVGVPALGVRPAGSRQEPAKQIEQAQ
jgi:hypothetical protein